MNLNLDFSAYTSRYFSRLIGGYARSLDGTGVRTWIPGHLNPSDAGGAWDATTRTFPALAAWLGAGRSAYVVTPRGEPVDIAAHVRAVFANAFNPKHPGYWGANTPGPHTTFDGIHQHTVESGSLAYAAWLMRDTILHDIPAEDLEHFKRWLEYFGRRAADNNWQLFIIVNHAARKALGWSYDQSVIDKGWKRINELEREDGWMTDGPENQFDDYNWWVFGTHELMWLQMDGASNPALAEKIRVRLRKRLEEYPYFFGADGGYTEFGRSLSYKFARLGFPLMAYSAGLWPHSPGMLKRLVRRHLAWYDDRGGIDRTSDLVVQTLTAVGAPDVRERYINTGHPYWCMLAFAGLWQVPADDPLWTCDEESLPVERGDFSRTIKPAGWMLEGIQKGGHVLRYSIGTQHEGAKYAKFCYGSAFPVNLGTLATGGFGPDASLCLTDGHQVVHPPGYTDLITGEGFVSAAYTLTLGEHKLACRTTLVPFGEVCVRVHQITSPGIRPELTLYEGASALGFAPGDVPNTLLFQQPPVSVAMLDKRVSAICGLFRYSLPLFKDQHMAGAPARFGHNAVFADAMVPYLRRPGRGETMYFVSATLATLSGFREFWKDITLAQTPDGGMTITCGDRRVQLPPALSVQLS